MVHRFETQPARRPDQRRAVDPGSPHPSWRQGLPGGQSGGQTVVGDTAGMAAFSPSEFWDRLGI